MKLSTKLFTLLAVLLIGVVAVGGFSLNRMALVNDKLTAISMDCLPSTVAVQNVDTLISDFRTNEVSHIYNENPVFLREYEQRMQNILKQLNEEIARYEKLISTSEERGFYDSFARDWKKYLEMSAHIVQLSNQLKTEEAANILRDESVSCLKAPLLGCLRRWNIM